jgi:hypothetical protein
VWSRVSRIAESLTREELITFYQETGAVSAPDLSAWTKEELLGVLDEIGEGDARKLIERYSGTDDPS